MAKKVWVSVQVGSAAPLNDHKVEITEAFDISDFCDAVRAKFTPTLDYCSAAQLTVILGDQTITNRRIKLKDIENLTETIFIVHAPEPASNIHSYLSYPDTLTLPNTILHRRNV